MSKLKTVMVGGPVHNKVWAVDAFLDGILKQDYPKNLISLVFYINDSTDGTKEVLLERLQVVKAAEEYRRVSVIQQNYGYTDIRHKRSKVRGRYRSSNQTLNRFQHFALVRNNWINLREDEEMIFSVDTDVVINESFALRRLVDHDVDLVAIPVNNNQNRVDGYHPGLQTATKMIRMADESGIEVPRDASHALIERARKAGIALGEAEIWNFALLIHGRLVWFAPRPEMFEVDVTGACCLMDSRLFAKVGAMYGSNSAGEDVFFCRYLKASGIRMWVDGRLSTIHMMGRNPFRDKEEMQLIQARRAEA